MYSAKWLDGIPTIQQDAHNILAVWDQNFAASLCDLPNAMDAEPSLCLKKYDRICLKGLDRAFGRKVQHV